VAWHEVDTKRKKENDDTKEKKDKKCNPARSKFQQVIASKLRSGENEIVLPRQKSFH